MKKLLNKICVSCCNSLIVDIPVLLISSNFVQQRSYAMFMATYFLLIFKLTSNSWFSKVSKRTVFHLNIRRVAAFICALFADFLYVVCSFSLNIIKNGLFILFTASLFCSLIFEMFFIFTTCEAFSPSIFSSGLSSLSIIQTLLQLSRLLLLPVISLFSLKELKKQICILKINQGQSLPPWALTYLSPQKWHLLQQWLKF